jgi:hypothetical protein
MLLDNGGKAPRERDWRSRKRQDKLGQELGTWYPHDGEAF